MNDLLQRPDGDTRVASPAVASLALRPVLTGPPRAVRELVRFSQALYLEVVGPTPDADPDTAPGIGPHADPGTAPVPVLAVLGADAVAVPGGLQLTTDLDHWADGPVTGTIGDGRLVVAGRHLVVHRWWDPVPRLRPSTRPALHDRGARAASLVPAVPGTTGGGWPTGTSEPSLAAAFERVLAALSDGDDRAAATAASALLGRGPGLTPSGDDLLAGLLASVPPLAAALTTPAPDGPVDAGTPVGVADPARPTSVGAADPARLAAAARRLAVTVATRAPGRTTTVSAELLRHAATGAVARPVLRLLRALTGHGALEPAVAGLLAVGSSSGHDLYAGVLGAVRLLTGGIPPHPTTHSLSRGS